MPRRKVTLEAKVAALRDSLRLMNVDQVAREHHLSRPALYKWYNKVVDALPDILANEKPGRKTKLKAGSAPPF
jgi:hypothetical protein